MSYYEILLFLHVATAIVWLGGGEGIAAARPAQFLQRRGVPNYPANRRQRLQMLGAGVRRRDLIRHDWSGRLGSGL